MDVSCTSIYTGLFHHRCRINKTCITVIYRIIHHSNVQVQIHRQVLLEVWGVMRGQEKSAGLYENLYRVRIVARDCILLDKPLCTARPTFSMCSCSCSVYTPHGLLYTLHDGIYTPIVTLLILSKKATPRSVDIAQRFQTGDVIMRVLYVKGHLFLILRFYFKLLTQPLQFWLRSGTTTSNQRLFLSINLCFSRTQSFIIP